MDSFVPMERASCPAMESSCIHSAKNPQFSTGGILLVKSDRYSYFAQALGCLTSTHEGLEPFSSRPFEPDVAAVTEYDDQVM